MAVNGTNLRVILNGVCVGAAKSCVLNTNTDMKDITTKDSAGVQENMPGTFSWSVDFDALYSPTSVVSAEEIIDWQIAKTKLTCEFATEGSGNGGQKWSGSAYISKHSITAATDDAVTISGTLTGTSILAKGTVSAS